MAICNFFKLSEFEKQFLLFMFLRDSTKDASLRGFFEAILASYAASDFAKGKGRNFLARTSSKAIFRNWVPMAILGLAKFETYQHEAHWIQEKPGGSRVLSLSDIRESMEELEEQGHLSRVDGKIKKTQETYFDDVAPFDLEENQRFQTGLHRTSLALNLKGMTSVHRPSRYQMHCLSVSRENVAELIRCYDEFKMQIVEISQPLGPLSKAKGLA